jgi:hypothetical protein
MCSISKNDNYDGNYIKLCILSLKLGTIKSLQLLRFRFIVQDNTYSCLYEYFINTMRCHYWKEDPESISVIEKYSSVHILISLDADERHNLSCQCLINMYEYLRSIYIQ